MYRVTGARREPREELARVLDVARAVEPEEALRHAVAPRVALERLVARRREELRRERLHVLVLAAEAVEEHHAGIAADGRGLVGDDDRARELRAVRGRDRQLLRRRRERRSAPDERSEKDCKEEARRPTTDDRVTLFYDTAMDARPVGVFDSGVGGLTVLHECLVTLPHEDFVYPATTPAPIRPAAAARGARLRA